MASSLITSWQMDGERVVTVIDFIFLGSKISADGDYSHEIKRHLLLGRKVMTNLDSILKGRDIAAAAAMLLQSCPTLCNPIDGSPIGSSVPGILQARVLEWVAIAFSIKRATGIQMNEKIVNGVTILRKFHN